jgi:hypothetical protein
MAEPAAFIQIGLDWVSVENGLVWFDSGLQFSGWNDLKPVEGTVSCKSHPGGRKPPTDSP